MKTPAFLIVLSFLIAFWDSLIAGETQAFTTNYDYDAFVMMTTPLGTLETISTFGEPWPMYEGAYQLLQTSDGGYAVTGTYHENGNWNSCIVRYTADGDTIWTKKWGDPDHSRYNYDIRELDDGGFITVGSIAATGQNPNVYLTRLGPGTTGKEEHLTKHANSITILGTQPNPFNTSTRLIYSLHQKGLVTVSPFDPAGEQISVISDTHEDVGTHELCIGNNLVPGIYFCKVQSASSSEVVKLVRTK
jgi:hypothetical protein